VANLFSTFDSYHSVRSMGDLINAHSSVYPNVEDLPATNVARALAGITTHLNDGEVRRVDRDQRVSLIHSERNRRFCVWANDFVKARYFSRSGVIGAMYATWLKDELEATVFWSAVRDETDHDPQAPSRTLSRFLRENTTNLSRGAWSAASKQWTPRAFYVKCLHAWNAYRSGGTTSLKYHEQSGIPKAA